MIQPTVGRIVYYHDKDSGSQPNAAIINCVHGDRMVSLCVFPPCGGPRPESSVPLIQESDEAPAPGSRYCEWMPYQKGQAAKTEALESKLAEKALAVLAFVIAMFAAGSALAAPGELVVTERPASSAFVITERPKAESFALCPCGCGLLDSACTCHGAGDCLAATLARAKPTAPAPVQTGHYERRCGRGGCSNVWVPDAPQQSTSRGPGAKPSTTAAGGNPRGSGWMANRPRLFGCRRCN